MIPSKIFCFYRTVFIINHWVCYVALLFQHFFDRFLDVGWEGADAMEMLQIYKCLPQVDVHRWVIRQSMSRSKISKWFLAHTMELFKFVGNIFCNRYWLVANTQHKKNCWWPKYVLTLTQSHLVKSKTSILIQKIFSVGFIIVPLIPLIITPLMHSCIFCLLVTSSIDYFNFALNTVILIVYKLWSILFYNIYMCILNYRLYQNIF